MRSSFVVLALSSLPFAVACSAFTGVDSDGLVPSSDSGTDGDSGTRSDSGRGNGSKDGGTANHDGGSTIETMGPDCTSLQSCCDFLDTTTAASCRSTALAEDESTCANDLLSYQAEGLCGDIAPPPFDSGTTTPPPIDSGSPLTSNCTLLLSCCSATTDASCLTTALAGDDTACESAYFNYVLAGVACTE